MARCSPFTVHFRADPDILFEKAMAKARDAGAQVSGDMDAGEVRFKVPMFGAIRVHYQFDGQSLIFQCKDRPLLLSCAMLEHTVREEIARADAKLGAQQA